MKNFIKTHKKQCLIGAGALLIIFFAIIIWLFIVPIFGGNKYGDRLTDIEDYEMKNEVIDTIENKLKENKLVNEVNYHNEGRILNFIINVSSEMSVADAKSLGDIILENIGDDEKSYYDIQILIDTEEENENYPIAGYKHKKEETFIYGKEASEGE